MKTLVWNELNEFKHKPVMTQVTPLLQACLGVLYR